MGIDVWTYAAICGAGLMLAIMGGAAGWYLGEHSATVARLAAIERLLLREQRSRWRRRRRGIRNTEL